MGQNKLNLSTKWKFKNPRSHYRCTTALAQVLKVLRAEAGMNLQLTDDADKVALLAVLEDPVVAVAVGDVEEVCRVGDSD